MIIETPRLYLRQMEQKDYLALGKILQDAETMYAYEHAFSNEEVQEWLDKQLTRYAEYGFGGWAVILKSTNEMIAMCGLSMQPYRDIEVLEIGYLLQRVYWHHAYATEAAIACRDYAFKVLGVDEVYSIIRDNNITSQNVARRNGMKIVDSFVKHYYGVDMPHLVFCIRRVEWEQIDHD